MSEGKDRLLMPGNSIDDFQRGAVLDLRTKVAMEMLTHSPAIGAIMEKAQPEEVALYCLDAATALLDLAAERGLATGFPESIEEHLKGHIRRSVQLTLEQQTQARRHAENDAKIARAVGGAFPGGNRQ